MRIARIAAPLAAPLLALGCGTAERVAAVPYPDAPSVRTEWRCEGGPDLRAVFYAADEPTVRLEREGETVLATQVRTASGARYDTADGRSLWVKGREAMLVWPEGVTRRCTLIEQG